jgi:hypothetical protein
MNPLRPALSGFDDRLPIAAVSLAFWINWALAIVNLLPAFPFDGGRLLRSLIWPRLGNYRAASVRVAKTAQIVAIGLAAAAAFFVDGTANERIPLWAPLVLLAIFLFFGAKQQLDRLATDGSEPADSIYDLTPDYLGLATEVRRETKPERRPSKIASWLARRREIKRRRQEIRLAEEERQADEILARVHSEGLDSITADERSILERVSARYRDRQSL